jgi:hypothetical protein
MVNCGKLFHLVIALGKAPIMYVSQLCTLQFYNIFMCDILATLPVLWLPNDVFCGCDDIIEYLKTNVSCRMFSLCEDVPSLTASHLCRTITQMKSYQVKIKWTPLAYVAMLKICCDQHWYVLKTSKWYIRLNWTVAISSKTNWLRQQKKPWLA